MEILELWLFKLTGGDTTATLALQVFIVVFAVVVGNFSRRLLTKARKTDDPN